MPFQPNSITFNTVSIGIMTQASKRAYLEVLWTSLLKQTISEPIEIILLSEEGYKPSYPKELEKQFTFKHLSYQRPFNIGLARNLIAYSAHGEYILYLDDDIAISPNYIHNLIHVLKKEGPSVFAGLSYQVFRKPSEFLKQYCQTSWENLLNQLGKRDSYSKRIGRYSSELISIESPGDSNWLGAIGRNITIKRNLILSYPFIEFKLMGFEDIEFAYRQQKRGQKIVLSNLFHFACLHLFHEQNFSKIKDYKQTFEYLVNQKKLPASSRKWFF